MPHPKIYGDTKRPSNLIPGHTQRVVFTQLVSIPHLHCKEIHLYFSNIAKASNQYQLLPQWINEVWPAPDLEEWSPFGISPITPSLVKGVLKKGSSNSSPREDGISYHHLKKVPSAHHFHTTRFSKILLKSHSAPSVWSKAKIKLIFKRGDSKQPSNFRPIALTSTVGTLFHKILAIRLERFLYSNDLIDPSAQKGFLTGINDTFEHIFSVSAILDKALLHLPLAMTFIDLKNAFRKVSH